MLVQLISFVGAIANSHYAIPLTALAIAVVVLRTWADGRATTRDRNMHGRVVVLTGAFSSIGLRLLTELAERGAQIIALTPSVTSPLVQELIPLLRQTTNNELIYAEECDIESSTSIRKFCAQLIQPKPSMDGNSPAEPQRLDALIMTHEYPLVTSTPQLPPNSLASNDILLDEHRLRPSLATFLLTTLILPSLLRAPSDRDIRIINVVNPLYAAAIPTLNPASPVPSKKLSLFVKEGYRSLRAIILGRHLQRIFDALSTPRSKLSTQSDSPSVVPDPLRPELVHPSSRYKGSNILSVVVSPGFTRAESVAPLFFKTGRSSSFLRRIARYVLYLLAYPVLLVITKSRRASIQSILHALFLPHPLKAPPFPVSPSGDDLEQKDARAIIEGGKFYRDCAVVVLPGQAEKEVLDREDIGHTLWEHYEAGVKRWDEEDKRRDQEEDQKGKGKETENENTRSD